MALANMVVFQEQLQTTAFTILQQQVTLFNAAVGNAIVLNAGNHRGDFSQESFYKSMGNLVRRRNPYANAAISSIGFEQDQKVSVKVGSGTPQVNWTKTEFDWINNSPALAATIIGRNLAQQMMDEYFNLALGVLYAAMRNDDALLRTDVTSLTSPADKANFRNMTQAQSKFGDASEKIQLWITHSKPVFDLYDTALANSEQLFNYGNIKVMRDPLGKRIIVSDSPSLVDLTTTPGTPIYRMMGLTPNSVTITQNDDFGSEVLPIIGLENLTYGWQAEWSFNMAVKGYSWDIANGAKAPNNAALLLSTNWGKWETNHKELPGVILEVN